MQKFTYSGLFGFLYRFGNIPVTILLSLYLILAASGLNQSLIYLLPFVIAVVLIFVLNRQYLNLYKILPYKIEADEEKMICSDFFFSKKKITIYYTDINSLSGGIFEGKYGGMMKVCDGKNNICIGFFSKLKNVQQLQTFILSKVERPIYDDVLKKVKAKKGEKPGHQKDKTSTGKDAKVNQKKKKKKK